MVRKTRRRAAERGMTLIEILVVITILGLIAAAVAVNVVGQLGEAKVKQAKTDLHTLENCLDLFKIDKGRYPSTEEGLQAVVTAGMISGSDRLQSPYPPGIPIGEVTRVDDAGTDAQQPHVRPYADLRRLEMVQVLTRRVNGNRP